MIRAFRSQLWLLATLLLLGAFVLPRALLVADDQAQQAQKKDDKKKDDKKKKKDDKKKDDKADNAAIKPAPRAGGPMKRHESFLARAKQGGIDVLFLGDSITQGWEGAGKAVWKARLEPQKAANFGIGGDRTQHVLWRITEGKELEGIQPKVAVLMIGTNNMRDNSTAEIAAGIEAIVKTLRQKLPKTKVLVLGVFPRAALASDPVRAKIKEVNKTVAKLDDGKSVRYLDIGDKFLEKDGTLTKEVMPDLLHLSPKGYEIWAEAIEPRLNEMQK